MVFLRALSLTNRRDLGCLTRVRRRRKIPHPFQLSVILLHSACRRSAFTFERRTASSPFARKQGRTVYAGLLVSFEREIT